MRRVLLTLLIVAAPAAAKETLAHRFPAKAIAYAELRDLGATVDSIARSPLVPSLRGHPAFRRAMATPQGRKLMAGLGFLRGATGRDLAGVLRALGADHIAAAVYGEPDDPGILVQGDVDPEFVQGVASAVAVFGRLEREELAPAAEGRSPLWSVGGRVFYRLRGGELVLSNRRELVEAALEGAGDRLDADASYGAARAAVGPRRTGFAYVDLRPFAAALRKEEKPDDLGAALLQGAFAHEIREAPWAAFGLDLAVVGSDVRLELTALLPRAFEDGPVSGAFGGRLDPLPFALPERTLGFVRLRRDLGTVWANRDALIAERGIPGLVELETNFGVITGGMNFVEDFLPNIGEEFLLLAVGRDWPPGKAPAVHLPAFALVFPIKDAEKLAPRFQVAFQTAIGIVNAQRAQEMQDPLLQGVEVHDGVTIQTARFLPPTEAEMEGKSALPYRFNFQPSVAVFGDHVVFASAPDVVRDLVDGLGEEAPAGAGANAGVWLRPAEIRRVLAENREPLVADSMLEEGLGREEAERRIDGLLDLGRFVKDLRITASEGSSSLSLTARAIFGTPED